MNMQRYLVDCSALYPLILKMREKIILYKDAFSILDLTIYEVGNVLWKEYGKGRIRDLKSAANLFQHILDQLPKLSVDDIGEVLDLAVRMKLTFYDAAYIHVARKRGLKLITEDRGVLSKYPEAIRVDQLEI